MSIHPEKCQKNAVSSFEKVECTERVNKPGFYFCNIEKIQYGERIESSDIREYANIEKKRTPNEKSLFAGTKFVQKMCCNIHFWSRESSW